MKPKVYIFCARPIEKNDKFEFFLLQKKGYLCYAKVGRKMCETFKKWVKKCETVLWGG